VETRIPRPGNGELLVRIKAALTCGTDLKAFTRGHPVIPMPGPFGHEFSGLVEARGKGARGFSEGDGVMAVHSAPCLGCGYCKKGLHNLCEKIMKTKVMGAFSEYILLPAHIVRQNVCHKPPGISFAEAALLEPLSCVLHGIEPLSVKKGETAMVIGTGPIGLMHLMVLKHRGAVAAVTDLNDARLRTARRLGADISVRAGHAERAVKKLTGGKGFDYVFECTGRPDVWESAVNYARRGGTVVLFGGCPPGTRVAYDTERLHYDEITLKGVFHFTPRDVRKAYTLLTEGPLRWGELISGTYPLREIGRAFEKLAEGKGIKYAITP
jgi:L-iditol 2-dehydrogenase